MSHPRALRAAACLTILGAGAGPAAHAQPREIRATAAFAVARDPSGQRAATRIDAALSQAVGRSEQLRPIQPARVMSGDPKTREEETLERARAALADGRRAYDALALDDAIARLGQSVSLYQQTGPLLGDLAELQVALTYLGAALTLRGSADEGESTFVELLTLNPGAPLEGFPPTVERVYERASGRVEGATTGSVEVYSTPPYAAVYVDGRFEGVTPLTVSELVAGTHYVRIEKTGYTVHGAPLEVAPGQRITSQTRLRDIKRGPELRDLTARAAMEVEAEGMGGALRTLARELIADTLVFVAVTQSGTDATLTGAVFDATTGARVATERVVLGVEGPNFERDLAQYVERLLTAATTGAPSSPTAQVSGGGAQPGSGGAFGLSGNTGGSYDGGYGARPPAPERTPSEVYLGWTLIGLGSAAVVTGSAFGIAALKVHGDFRDTPQGSPDLVDIQDTGKRNALVADICLITGGALALGGTAILLFSSHREPTPQEILQNPRAALTPLPGGAALSFGGEF
jgi:hypothetical protein